MTIKELLEILDGAGLVITDWEEIENMLDDLELSTASAIETNTYLF